MSKIRVKIEFDHLTELDVEYKIADESVKDAMICSVLGVLYTAVMPGQKEPLVLDQYDAGAVPKMEPTNEGGSDEY